jgi:predicted metalloprotease
MQVPIGRGGLGIGGLIIVGIIALALGIDPSVLIGNLDQVMNQPQFEQRGRPPMGPGGPTRPTTQPKAAPTDQTGQFVAAVLAQTEDVWKQIFKDTGQTYREPRLVLFANAVQSACGFGQAAMGPFYCPQDQRVYLDISFFRVLRERFRAPGDFAAAYVVAHEVGHHVQNLMGIMPRVMEQRQRLPQPQANALSVRLELQADCFAGVWAHFADTKLKVLEPGDVEKALAAASAIGDDQLQRQTQGRVAPESFTHGTSAQRVAWFTTGVKTGSVQRCNTFAPDAKPAT